MKCVFLVFFHVLLLCSTVVGQTMVKGYIVGSKSEPLVGASVILLRKSDSSVVKGTVSTRSGEFNLHGIGSGKYLLKISYVGYKHNVQYVEVSSTTNKDLGKILLAEKNQQLSEFVLNQKAIIAEVKGDTTEFNAAAVKVNKDAVAEDLVTKLPGVTVENGTIKAQGEEVKQVLVDNVEFFGNDASIALKNLPAEIIDRVQLYDKASEESAFTGFKDAETNKTLNIKTKKNKNTGVFGNLQMGYANDDRYKLNGNINFFNGARRISVLGGSNNINEQNFSSQDVLGIGKMGGAHPSPVGSLAGGMLGSNNGISTNHSIGINYSDQWNNRWKVNGSYFYNQTENANNRQTDRTYFLNDSSKNYYRNATLSNSKNYNHRMNARLEYKIDSSSNLMIVPSISYQKNEANSSSQSSMYNNAMALLQNIHSQSISNNDGYDMNNAIYYRKKFAKKGRSLFVDFSQSLSQRNGKSITESELINQQTETDNNSWNLSSRINYTEPLSEKSLLKFVYAPSLAENTNNTITKTYDNISNDYSDLNTELSGKYRLQTNKQQGGVGYLYQYKKLNLNLGGDYQLSMLNGEQRNSESIDKTYNNWLWHGDLFYKFNKRSHLHIGYNTNTKNPTASQLQSTTNNSNELYQTQGNAGLNQQYTHELRCMYRTVDYTLTRSFFMAAHASISDNYIGNSSFTANKDTLVNGASLSKGAQLSRPTNLNGYISADGFMTYSFPLYPIKSNMNLQAGYSYTQLPGIINELKNYAYTNAVNGSVGLVSNISENIDYTLSYRANYNWIENSLQSKENQNYYSGNASARINLSAFSHWVLTSDANLSHYLGLSEEYNKPYILWNASVAYKFLKNNAAEFRFSIYDLLKQNRSISRNVSDTYVEDLRNEVLQQYFMLSFSYKLREFKQVNPTTNNQPN